MAPSIEFVSIKGRVYDERTVLPVVFSILASRFSILRGRAWRDAVRCKMRDETWVRCRSGMCPAGLAYELESTEAERAMMNS